MKQSGVTLIELLIVVAIIAILAGMAVPMYSQYLAKGEMRVAQSDLELVAVVFENRYQRVLSYPNAAYSTTQDLLTALPQWSPSAESQRFNFSSTDPETTSYTVQATGLSGLYENCVIKLESNGTKTILNCPKLAPDGSWL